MKKIIYILLLLISFNVTISKEIQISNPIVSDYYDCIYKDNQIIVYGTNGFINISNDDGKSWTTQKIFDKGKIVFMSYEEDGIYAINENGEISKSVNNSRYFLPYPTLDITPDSNIWAVIKFDNNFLLRTYNNLFLLDKNFILTKSEQIPKLNLDMYVYIDSTWKQFNNNMTVYNNNIIVCLDSAQFLVYDKNLNFKDKLNLFYELDESLSLVPAFKLNDKIIFNTYDYTFKYDFENKKIDTLFQFNKPENQFSPFLKDVVDDKFMFLPHQVHEQFKLHFVDINGNLDTTVQILNKTFTPKYGHDNVKKTINKVIKKDNKYIL